MLTLTENASTIARTVAAQSGEDGAGLRIAPDQDQGGAFGVTLANRAEPGDEVLEQDGATVYLESQAAQELSDKVLDAGMDEAGNVQFALGEQA